MFQFAAARSSWRSWTTAQGRIPVRGSSRPTGRMGPKRRLSSPRRAISSTGRHASKKRSFSNSPRLTPAPSLRASTSAA